jgi:hypothetical protein
LLHADGRVVAYMFLPFIFRGAWGDIHLHTKHNLITLKSAKNYIKIIFCLDTISAPGLVGL